MRTALNGRTSRSAQWSSLSHALLDMRCPRCAGELDEQPGSAHCLACNAEYPVHDGIIDLRCGRNDYYFNPVPPARMDELVREMTLESWPRIIREFVLAARSNNAWLDNLVVDGRYSWKMLLDLPKDAVVLDLGCGLGNLTHNVAPLVERVYAMDLTYARLQFSRKRFSLFNRKDDIVTLAAGDGPHLPFRSGSLDAVLISGVLEWVGEGDTAPFEQGSKMARLLRMLRYQFGEHNPRTIQLRFLKEVRRILKPEGQLFVAIENRLNHEYFAGRRDHHSLLRYGSLLPRFAATLYSILVNRKPYRTYTYSTRGYRKLLCEAGFPKIEFFGLSRGYSALNEITPAAADVPDWRPAPSATLRERIHRHKLFVPAYGIVASAAAEPRARRQDAVLAAVERDARACFGEGQLLQHRYTVSARQSLVIEASYDGHALNVRVPMNATAEASERANAEMLQTLARAGVAKGIRPHSIAIGSAEGFCYFVEEKLEGKPLTEMPSPPEVIDAGEIERFLAALDSAAPRIRMGRLEGLLYEEHVTRWITSTFRMLGDTSMRMGVTEFFHRTLYGAEIAVGLMHGSFCPENIVVSDGRISGLTGWEAASMDGLPILDAIEHLLGLESPGSPTELAARAVPVASRPATPNADFIRRRYEGLRMDPARHPGWVYLVWLRRVSRELTNILQYDPVRIEREVSTVLRTISESAVIPPAPAASIV